MSSASPLASSSSPPSGIIANYAVERVSPKGCRKAAGVSRRDTFRNVVGNKEKGEAKEGIAKKEEGGAKRETCLSKVTLVVFLV
ncbi:hypothetical protein AAHA92_09836 [Salvia divinorum]|uniref:Uncharacterized protein n=1 Tax=Salvia divinorum TaxID=28513 RepID=A0ABD1HSM4_SALDI